MFTSKNQGLISLPLVVLSNLLMTQNVFAAGASTTAMLAAVSKMPYQTASMPDATTKAVTKNQAPLIHDDVWIAVRKSEKSGSAGSIQKIRKV